MRMSAAKITRQTTIPISVFFTFLITISHKKPVPSSRTTAATKSDGDYFTSFVKCIAINGMSSKSAAVITIPKSLLFFVDINVLFIIVVKHYFLYKNFWAIKKICIRYCNECRLISSSVNRLLPILINGV